MEPRISPKVKELLASGQDLEALRFIVDRMWPLKRESETPRDRSSIAAHFHDPTSGLEMTAVIVTASNIRSGDVFLSLLDTSTDKGQLDSVIRESVSDRVFSRTLTFRTGNDPKTLAIFNSFCLIADSLARESRPVAAGYIEKSPRVLQVGVAERTIESVITRSIDFSAAFTNGMPRLYCDDSQVLDNGAPTAWIDFSLSTDRKTLSLKFSQRVDGEEYNPYLPRVCLREPIMGGSRYRGVRVQAAFKVLFAVDGIFQPPPPPGLTLPPIN